MQSTANATASVGPPRREHRKRALRIWPGLAIAWTLATFGANRLASLNSGNLGLHEAFTSMLIGGITAYIMAVVETRPLAQRVRRSGRGGDLLVRTVLYGGVAFLTVAVSYYLLQLAFPVTFRAASLPPFSTILSLSKFWIFICLLLLASLAINFFLHLRLVVGAPHLRALFIGRYREPVLERRVFVFIDLVDSTSIAQEIGPLQFTHFKHDFFSDLSDAVLDTDGQIIQYVGDEVMLSWREEEAQRTGGPLNFLGLARERLLAREQHYLDAYGFTPRFRTGVHAGEVVVAEVGDIRRDIVYSGDVVNTAARLLQACRPSGVTLLISRQAHELMPVAFRQNFTPREAIELRGRTEPLHVFCEP